MPNHLAGSTSPYLLQHADNPVDWRKWGAEAFEEARRRDVPVLLSVGYAACHWCHVMAHESFEDEATAAQMNENFVCVKVDREERPDVDNVYMTATQALTGQGGWPMTVFATPDGRPFYCGTYFPPRPAHGMPAFRQVLGAMADAWRDQRDEVEAAGGRGAAAISSRPQLEPPPGAGPGRAPRGCRPRCSTGRWTPWRAASTRDAEGSTGHRSSRRPWCWSSCSATPPAPATSARCRWPAARSRRWRAAASTPSSPAASPATRSTPTGWCRTSRRCSTTTRCCCGSTCTCGGPPVSSGPAGWPTRRPT